MAAAQGLLVTNVHRLITYLDTTRNSRTARTTFWIIYWLNYHKLPETSRWCWTPLASTTSCFHYSSDMFPLCSVFRECDLVIATTIPYMAKSLPPSSVSLTKCNIKGLIGWYRFRRRWCPNIISPSIAGTFTSKRRSQDDAPRVPFYRKATFMKRSHIRSMNPPVWVSSPIGSSQEPDKTVASILRLLHPIAVFVHRTGSRTELCVNASYVVVRCSKTL